MVHKVSPEEVGGKGLAFFNGTMARAEAAVKAKADTKSKDETVFGCEKEGEIFNSLQRKSMLGAFAAGGATVLLNRILNRRGVLPRVLCGGEAAAGVE